MISKFKKWWKYSSIRFYVLNALWNYRFWISCKKKYKQISYFKRDFFKNNSHKVTKRRFDGYLYKGSVYLDNPGMQNIDKDVWDEWKKKGLF